MKWIKCLAILSTLVGGSLPSRAVAADLIVIFETAIRDVPLAAQVGMKSRQRLAIDFDARGITPSFETGVTDFLGFSIGSVRDQFKVEAVTFTENRVSFRVVGQTASGMLFLPDIDYSFTVTINRQSRLVTVAGCHNEYPSYAISVGGRSVYDRLQTGNALWGLKGNCDIQVNTSANY